MFLCKQKTAYEMRIIDWSSDVCSSDRQPGYVEAFLDRHRYAEQRLVRSGRRAVHRPGGFERAFEVADHHRIDMRIETLDPRDGILHRFARAQFPRSEERRVGKESVSTCRSRWSPDHYKKKNK